MTKQKPGRQHSHGSKSSQQIERYTRVAAWVEDSHASRDGNSSADLLGRRAAEAWLRIIGLA